MSSTGFTLSRRAALTAIFAVGLHCTVGGRARADEPSVSAPAATQWQSLEPEQQKLLSRYGDRWNSLPPDQQQRSP